MTLVVTQAGGETRLALHWHDGQQARVLGPGAGLWTPSLCAGIDMQMSAPPTRAGGRTRQSILLAQGNGLAEAILAEAALRRLPLLAAIGVGQSDSSALAHLVQLAASLPGPPLLLVALHQRPSLELIWQLGARSSGGVLLLLIGDARKPVARSARTPEEAAPLPEPGAAAFARAASLPTASTVSELVELAHLLRVGRRVHTRRVKVVARGEDDAALAGEALTRAGLEEVRSSRAGDLVLATPHAWTPGTDALRLAYASSEGPLSTVDARHDTLAALATLARLPRTARAASRPRARLTRARQLLDGWHRDLHQVQLQQLLACHDIRMPPAGLATSASMAARLARRIGTPVAVKAVGPGLLHAAKIGAVRLGVVSIAGVRQAFRDVLQACSTQHAQQALGAHSWAGSPLRAQRPRPTLEGVLVQSIPTTPHRPRGDLQCLLTWSDTAPAPLLWLHLPPAPPGIHLCPLSRATALQAAEELEPQLPAAALRSMAQFLFRLSWFGADLADRMCWLWIEAIALPVGRRPPLVLDAVAEQTESLRAPVF